MQRLSYNYVKRERTSMPKTAESSLNRHKEPTVEKALTCPNEPKVDPRVRRTRKLIEDAFRQLMKQKHFSDISVADIAEMATVNRATFYLHFEGKEHLAESVLRDNFRDAVLHRIHEQEIVTIESFVELATATIEFIDGSRHSCAKAVNESESLLTAAVLDLLQRMLQRWFELDRDALKLFKTVNQDVLISTIAWSIYGGAINWGDRGRLVSPDRQARAIIELLSRA